MGASLSWIAFNHISRNELVNKLGLCEVAASEEVNRGGRFEIHDMENGWCVVVGKEPVEKFLALNDLSKGGALVWCAVEEHVNYSATGYWKDGAREWELSHHPEQNDDMSDLTIEGQLPSNLGKIRDRLVDEQQQSDCDVISDLAVEIGEAVTGFRHDVVLDEISSRMFEVVEGGVMDQSLVKMKKYRQSFVIKIVTAVVGVIAAAAALGYWFRS
ncbi:MAG: hypothetical protein L3J39_06100 [Verrucomicrobiales bacterium]|nr:hypothetical protein [Verrucomicrobiales bacterium]